MLDYDWEKCVANMTLFIYVLIHFIGTVQYQSLADPGGSAPGARPPLTAADLRFFYAQNA